MSTSKEMLWSRGRELVEGAPSLYIDTDIEADGIAGYGSMLSIGAVGPAGDEFYSEIKPLYNEYLPDYRAINEANGLEYERLMEEAPAAYDVLDRLHEWVMDLRRKADKPAVFTAFGAAYDWAFVDLYFVRLGITNPFEFLPFDLKSLAAALANDTDWDNTKKRNLPPEIVPDDDFAHHALDDARYQQKLHFGMVALLEIRQSCL